MKLTNQTILITGGTSGIGLELGRQLKKRGNTVILLGRNSKKSDSLKKEGFDTILCDLSNLSAIETLALQIQNEHPDISVLFNNAGIQYNYQFTDTIIPISKIAEEIQINLTSQILLTQLLVPLLADKEEALIVNTTSGLASYPKIDGLVYSASKAGLRNFTTGLRDALSDTSIKVVEFIPPVTDTGMTSGRTEQKLSARELVSTILPQFEAQRDSVTIPSLRLFKHIAYLRPALARKILNKKH